MIDESVNLFPEDPHQNANANLFVRVELSPFSQARLYSGLERWHLLLQTTCTRDDSRLFSPLLPVSVDKYVSARPVPTVLHLVQHGVETQYSSLAGALTHEAMLNDNTVVIPLVAVLATGLPIMPNSLCVIEYAIKGGRDGGFAKPHRRLHRLFLSDRRLA